MHNSLHEFMAYAFVGGMGAAWIFRAELFAAIVSLTTYVAGRMIGRVLRGLGLLVCHAWCRASSRANR